MPRWNKGSEVIERQLEDRHLEATPADADTVERLIETARRHIGVVEAINAQFPGVDGLRSIDRLRRRRNQAEYS
jgi:hypothetical protein